MKTKANNRLSLCIKLRMELFFNTCTALIPQKKTICQVSGVSVCNVYSFRVDKSWYMQLMDISLHLQELQFTSLSNSWVTYILRTMKLYWLQPWWCGALKSSVHCSSLLGSNFIVWLRTYIRTSSISQRIQGMLDMKHFSLGMADAGWEGKAKMLFCGRKISKREVANCQI